MLTGMRSLLILVVFSFVPQVTFSATLYMDPAETDLRPGDTVLVAVRLNTDENECINVVDGVIDYPDTVLPVDISRGDSILPVWVEEPTIDKESQQITFAGGIPNGYCGRIAGDPRLTNVLLEIAFQVSGRLPSDSEEPVLSTISFSPNTQVLLNDGTGSAARLRTIDSTISVYENVGSEIVNEWGSRVDADVFPPNEFTISLQSDPSIFGGKYFIVFNTTDKQSGLDHYEVIEEPLEAIDWFRFGAATAPWIVAESPYRLKDQSLNSTIRVKAVDKAGNEYITTLLPDEAIRGTSPRTKLSIALFLIGVLIILIVIAGAVAYRRTSRSPFESDN